MTKIPFGINNPLPQSLELDCAKCAKIMEKFKKPEQGRIEEYIPNDIIAQARGIAIMTVVKAGFIWSGRVGTGLVVARLPNGEWSAPSAIGTAGMGIGGQIGGEITDFVIVLNTDDAVKAFSMGGNVTLGGSDVLIPGNLSIAAGPVGRSAEAAGTIGKLAPIYSYSKTKGLFAGISLEGSVILERKEANEQFYHSKANARMILSGGMEKLI
jgi:lipid-binding SYLF domain-containing protein